MPDDAIQGNGKERLFKLFIREQVDEQGRKSLNLSSTNEGVNSADLIILVEMWLEQARQSYRNQFGF